MQLTALNDFIPAGSHGIVELYQSTKLSELSYKLSNHDLELQLTTTKAMNKYFIDNKYESVAFELMPAQSYYDHIVQGESFAQGATLLINMLLGELTQEQAVERLKSLGDRHKSKAEQLSKNKLQTVNDRAFMDGRITIGNSRHSFNIRELHKLANHSDIALTATGPIATGQSTISEIIIHYFELRGFNIIQKDIDFLNHTLRI